MDLLIQQVLCVIMAVLLVLRWKAQQKTEIMKPQYMMRWDRKLTPQEMRELDRDPYQMFNKPPPSARAASLWKGLVFMQVFPDE